MYLTFNLAIPLLRIYPIEILYTYTRNYEQVCVLLVHTFLLAWNGENLDMTWMSNTKRAAKYICNTCIMEYWAAIQKKELDLDVVNYMDVGL